jgi:hypothetical protein
MTSMTSGMMAVACGVGLALGEAVAGEAVEAGVGVERPGRTQEASRRSRRRETRRMRTERLR